MRKVTLTRTLKLFHIIGSTGFCAALLGMIIIHASLPDPGDVEQFAAFRIAMGNLATWLLLPSTGLVVVSGLFAIAFNDAYKSAGWVWAKLATGILVLEGTLVYVQAPMERAANNALLALERDFDPGELGLSLVSEWYSFWIILGVASLNIVLAVYRPRFSRRPEKS